MSMNVSLTARYCSCRSHASPRTEDAIFICRNLSCRYNQPVLEMIGLTSQKLTEIGSRDRKEDGNEHRVGK